MCLLSENDGGNGCGQRHLLRTNCPRMRYNRQWMMALLNDTRRAVDKIIGWAVLGGHFPLDGQMLVVSGPSRPEIVQKPSWRQHSPGHCH